ncbi:dTDP-4-dehydrorhamnose 3,5-epimerase [Puniceicoccaceae bacterium K14]|nr:dTDP-4-dehydrorhamnose 3,5-epimerase [Puniceicoccaceae bacterium K14]
MIFNKTKIEGAYLIDLEPIKDDRGFFSRAWSKAEFQKHGLVTDYPEWNLSYNNKEGTTRGMHFQKNPHAEVKLVRCTRGSLVDIFIDLRKDSPTRYEWASIELRPEKYQFLYIPAGCAHGYQTLEDETEITYSVSSSYASDSEGSIRWNDPFFSIKWPKNEDVIISEKDGNCPDFDPTNCPF